MQPKVLVPKVAALDRFHCMLKICVEFNFDAHTKLMTNITSNRKAWRSSDKLYKLPLLCSIVCTEHFK